MSNAARIAICVFAYFVGFVVLPGLVLMGVTGR